MPNPSHPNANLNLEKIYELYRSRNKGSIIRSVEYFNLVHFNIDLANKIGVGAACLLSYFEKFHFLSPTELKELVLPSELRGKNFDKYIEILKDHKLIEIEELSGTLPKSF